MRRTLWWSIAAALVIAAAGLQPSAAAAKKRKAKPKKSERIVSLEKIPDLARARILNEAGDSKVGDRVEVEKEGGQVLYEASWRVKGREVEVKVTADGRLVEREAEISLDDVPAAARKTILKAAGKARVKEVEEVVAGGRKFYEAEWSSGGKEIEVKVAPDGKLLGKEVEEEDDDDDDDDDGDDGEEEEEVSLDDVPAAVRATILKQAGKHKITEIEKETKGGRTVYEAEWKVGKKEVEIKVAPDGRLLKKKGGPKRRERKEKEKKLTLDDVPAAVRATILKHAGKHKVTEIEKETKGGRTVYEAEWKVGKKEVEIEVSPSGKLLDKEVDDDDD